MGRYEADHILFGAAYYDEYLMMKGASMRTWR